MPCILTLGLQTETRWLVTGQFLLEQLTPNTHKTSYDTLIVAMATFICAVLSMPLSFSSVVDTEA